MYQDGNYNQNYNYTSSNIDYSNNNNQGAENKKRKSKSKDKNKYDLQVGDYNPNQDVPYSAGAGGAVYPEDYPYQNANNNNTQRFNQPNNVNIYVSKGQVLEDRNTKNNYINPNQAGSNNIDSNRSNANLDQNGTKWNNINQIEKTIRLGFIKKVYAILSLQLLLTFGCVCLTFIKEVRQFLRDFFYIYYAVAVISIIILLVLICGKSAAKKVPSNYILLFSWTICETYLVMTICAYYDWELVVTAMGMTVGISTAWTIYACYTKTNFTYWGGILWCASFILIIFGLFGLWFNKWLKIVYCALGVLLFSIYLIYDTQLILGNFRIRYSIDDYVIAALYLFIDILQIFIRILSLFGIATS